MPPLSSDPTTAMPAEPERAVREARLWQDSGWTARVVKNEDDDGWAVAMYKDGEAEPALVGPWTMGRDKKNPKPLDRTAFSTLVKTVTEFVGRQEQQAHARLHQRIVVAAPAGRIDVALDIVPDEDEPYALLSARDEVGAELAQIRVAPNFRLSRDSAAKWVESGFGKP